MIVVSCGGNGGGGERGSGGGELNCGGGRG